MADTLRKLVSMELDDEDKHDTLASAPVAMPETPDYPYGLRNTFSEVELKKLKLDPDEAETGAYFTGCFRACITSVSKNEVDGKVTHRIEWQIEELAIDTDDKLPGEDEAGPPRRGSVLYEKRRKSRQEADDGDEGE